MEDDVVSGLLSRAYLGFFSCLVSRFRFVSPCFVVFIARVLLAYLSQRDFVQSFCYTIVFSFFKKERSR